MPKLYANYLFEFELWEYEKGGNGHAELYYDTFPIMSDSLIKALQEAGVNNLQLFPAILRDLKKRYCKN